MAKTKRKAAPASQASPKKTPSSTRSSQRVRPSVEFVEISSDEPGERLPGAARGLSERNILPPPSESVEQIDDDDNDDDNDNEDTAGTNQVNRRMTRGSRNGRTDDRINYDMKYHPMDEITRPKWAAQRHSGSRSLSPSAFNAGDRDTSDASLPSSAKGSDNEASSDEEGSAVEELPARIPDPHATRRSARTEATKDVNYSRKHHPQDHGLPGHQHKAKLLKRLEKKRKKASGRRPSPKVQVPSQNEDAEDNIIAYDSDDEEDLEQEGSSALKPTARPRKKLRVLEDDRSSSPRKSRKKGRPPAKSTKGSSTNQRSDPFPETHPEEDTVVYVDDVMGSAEVEPVPSSDDVEAAQNLNGLVDDAQTSSSSARNISSVLATKQARPIGGLNTFASDTEEDPQDFVDKIQSQYPSQEHGVERASAAGDHDATSVSGNDDLSEDEEDDLFADDKDEEPAMGFKPQSLASIAAGAPRNRNSVSGRTGSMGTSDVIKNNARGRAPRDEASRSVQRADGGAMGPPQSTAEPGVIPSAPTPQENGIATRIATLARTTNRMESSSSTTMASTRAASSSSTLKASSQVNSRAEATRPRWDAEDRRIDTCEGETPSAGNPRAALEEEQRKSSAQTNTIEADLDGLMDPQGMPAAGTTTEARYAQVARSQTQPISPVASFNEGEVSKPVTSVIFEQQQVTGSSDQSDESRRARIARESSRLSLHSPEPTPRRMGTAPPLSQSQQSRGGTLLYSDPDDAPMEDGERTEDEESSDPILPFLSADSSSPSKSLDVI